MKKSVIEIYSVNYMSKEATCYRLLIALNRLTRASHKQHLTKAYIRSLQIYLIRRSKYKEAVKMGRQRNRPEMKEQENSPGEELNEMEASNLSDRV